MRTKKSISKGISTWSDTKFSEVTSEEFYGEQ